MSTTAATGFCRVTVVAPDSRIDVALPEDVAVADVYPEILRLVRPDQPQGAPTGYHLVRRDGTVLDGARSLAAQQVLDGEVLLLRPFAESLPPAVFDDVSDAVASAVDARPAAVERRPAARRRPDRRRAAARPDGASSCGSPTRCATTCTACRASSPAPPVSLLAALAGVRARVYDDHDAAVALGLGALPHLMVARLRHHRPSTRARAPAGCSSCSAASPSSSPRCLLVLLLPQRDAPFVAAAFVAGIGTLATFAAIVTEAEPRETAAVAAVVAVAVIAFLPGSSARFARLPIGFALARPDRQARPTPTDQQDAGAGRLPSAIAAQARRGHELLLGLVGGCAAVVVASAVRCSASPAASGPSCWPWPPASRC